jgi:hypothetical protein
MKKPMVMMVDSRFPSLIHPVNNWSKVSPKNSPQINASLDKNKSQRIGDFSLK